MADPGASPAPGDVADLALQIGERMLAAGADAIATQDAVRRVCSAFGLSADLVVTGEVLMISASSSSGPLTCAGRHAPALGVDLRALGDIDSLVGDIVGARSDLLRAAERLAAIADAAPLYRPWVVVLMMGLTAACLARLLGADGAVTGLSFCAGAVCIAVRMALVARGVNLMAALLAASLCGGLVGGAGTGWLPGNVPSLCLISAGMILVPGVPLINAIRDGVDGRATLGVVRLAISCLMGLAIACGLALAGWLTRVPIAVNLAPALLPSLEDVLVSALAAAGFVALFNVPWRSGWPCLVCGAASHGLRTALMHGGLDVICATFAGALVGGGVAVLLARRFAVPPVVFAFPGVVAMIPGSYALRASAGALDIMSAPETVSAVFMAQTVSLWMTTGVLLAAIAVGLGFALMKVPRPPSSAG